MLIEIPYSIDVCSFTTIRVLTHILYKPILLISTFGGVRQRWPVWVDPGPGRYAFSGAWAN